MLRIHARALTQVLGDQMLARAGTQGGIARRAPCRAYVHQEAFEIGRWRIARDHQYKGGRGDHADQREAMNRVVRDFLDHDRGYGVARADHQARVAVAGAPAKMPPAIVPPEPGWFSTRKG